MFKRLYAALVALAVIFCANAASAQTISQLTATSAVSAVGHGQSFTATLTGAVTQIQVRPRTTQASTLYFFNGGGSGTVGSNASAVYSQAVNLVDTGTDFAGLQTIVLTTPVPVTAGSTYTFAFDTGGFATGAPDPYPGGSRWANYANPGLGSDFVFTVSEQLPAPPATVPTLSEWAMILFGMALAGLAALHIHRRRQVA